MERIQSINPERIMWCCSDYGITPSVLASELGISAASMDRVMAGKDGMTFNQLRKVSEYFGRGILFLLEAEPVDETQVHTPQFRTLANQKPELSTSVKKLIERVEKQRAVYLSLLEDLEETEQIRFNPPKLPHNDIRDAARIAREWLRLTDENTFDTYRLSVESVGVLVFRSNGYNGKWQISKENPILGITLYDASCPVIFIKKNHWDSQQSFTLMHELGHLLLHKASAIDDDHDLRSLGGRERDANAFAGQILVPDTFLASIRDADRPEDVSQYDVWLERQRKDWGVSSEVILRRLMDNSRLSKYQYLSYRKWSSKLVIPQKGSGNRTYRYREPRHMFGDTFVRTVLYALNARHITLAKASSYLDSLKIKDLHRLEDFYAGI
jgi:Zn-dependent peptidase ImmA (M78 family)